MDERFKIYEIHNMGYSSRYIAQKIGRDKSTVCYELKKMKENYRPDRAHALTLHYRTGKRRKRLELDDKLRIEIIEQLKLGIAPDVIAGRRKLEQKSVNISTESIYQFIYTSTIAKEDNLYLYIGLIYIKVREVP